MVGRYCSSLVQLNCEHELTWANAFHTQSRARIAHPCLSAHRLLSGSLAYDDSDPEDDELVRALDADDMAMAVDARNARDARM